MQPCGTGLAFGQVLLIPPSALVLISPSQDVSHGLLESLGK